MNKYQSLIRFHKKRLMIDRKPTKLDLMNDEYRYRGFLIEANRIIYNTPEDDPYNEKILKEHYLQYNKDVIRYFRLRNDLLMINLKNTGGYQQFCDFLGVELMSNDFPWLNRSQ